MSKKRKSSGSSWSWDRSNETPAEFARKVESAKPQHVRVSDVQEALDKARAEYSGCEQVLADMGSEPESLRHLTQLDRAYAQGAKHALEALLRKAG